MTAPLLDQNLGIQLDQTIEIDPQLGVAAIVWLSTGATSTSSASTKAEVAKVNLRQVGLHRLDSSIIPSDRKR